MNRCFVLISACLLMIGKLHALDDAATASVNRYVAFQNECLHLLYESRSYLESLNESLVVAVEEDRAVTLDFPFHQLYHDGKMFTFLQGTCTRTSNTIDQGLDLEVLFQKTNDNQALSYEHRSRLNEFRNASWQLMLEFIDESYTLMGMAVRARPTAPEAEALFDQLRKIEDLYENMEGLNADFRTYLESITSPLPEVMRPFQSMVTSGEALIHAVRTNNEAGIYAARQALIQSVELSRQTKSRYRSELGRLGLWFDEEEESAYDHIIEYGELMLQRSQPQQLSSRVRSRWNRYPVSYHHVNERLIDLYNHHKYGLTSYYKTLIDHSDKVFLHPLDIAPWFMVIFPQEPEPEPVAVISTPSPAPIQEEFSLAAAPANNLVFLIDVSASMNRPEKLPLFKDNLEYLVSLFRPEDQIAIVTFSGEAEVILEPTRGMFPSEIKAAIRELRTGGSTNARKGFRQAYRLAEEQFLVNGTNRVVLITDGIFDTDRNINSQITRYADMDIQLSVMYLANREAPQVKSRLMQLAEMGEGRYSHFHADNAKEVLVSEARGE